MYGLARMIADLQNLVSNVCYLSQEELNHCPLPTMRWGIKIKILDKLWANPIPNSNSRIPMQNF